MLFLIHCASKLLQSIYLPTSKQFKGTLICKPDIFHLLFANQNPVPSQSKGIPSESFFLLNKLEY